MHVRQHSAGWLVVDDGNYTLAGPYSSRTQAVKGMNEIHAHAKHAKQLFEAARAKRRRKAPAYTNDQRIADHVDGYDRDDIGESPDY